MRIKGRTGLIVVVSAGLLLLSMGDISLGRIKSSDDLKDEIKNTWKALSENKRSVQVWGGYPYIACFKKASKKHNIPLPILLAVARGESGFNPRAISNKGCIGIMQIQWPGTAKDLGITIKSELFDPCINIDAGARYLSWLLDKYSGDPFLALAGYNYGPNGFSPQKVPEKARGYVAYIHRHLQAVLSGSFDNINKVLILQFTYYKSAADLVAYLETQVEGLPLEIFKSRNYTYDVYLTYRTAKLRHRYLQQLKVKTGIKPKR